MRRELAESLGLKVELEMELKRQNYPFKKKIQALEGEIEYLQKAVSHSF